MQGEKMSFVDKYHVIQEVEFPPLGYPEQVYFHCFDADGSRLSIMDMYASDGTISLKSDCMLSSNTYINSLYLAYWQEYSQVDNVYMVVEFEGELEIHVHGVQYDFAVHKLATAQAHSGYGNRRYIKLPPLSRGSMFQNSQLIRVFFDIIAVKDSILKSIQFVTDVEPVRDVAMSIGICTFNRENDLAHNLEQIASLAKRHSFLKKVYIVNQGKEFSKKILLEVLDNPLFEVIRQGNLGGCGGFTRTLYEAQASEKGLTHHLLMDDDIILDAGVIYRAACFLQYSEAELAIGGAMLDRLAPHVMFEAGAFICRNNTIKAFGKNIDVCAVDGPNSFARLVKTDYNAWWFCVVPLGPSKQIGLPAPIFIRGDDFEYGRRLASKGIPTVTLPGVVVWHEPFYVKAAGWQEYYDLRNRLIFAATYPHEVRISSHLEILDILFNDILCHRYGQARLKLQAVKDFLDGPEKVFSTPADERHKEIMQLAKGTVVSLNPMNMRIPGDLSPNDVVKRPKGTRNKVLSYIGLFLKNWLLPVKKKRKTLMDIQVHPVQVCGRRYVVTNGPRTYFYEYSPEKAELRRLTFAALAIGRRYKRRKNATTKEWGTQIGSYRKTEFWDGVFKKQEAATEQKFEAALAQATVIVADTAEESTSAIPAAFAVSAVLDDLQVVDGETIGSVISDATAAGGDENTPDAFDECATATDPASSEEDTAANERDGDNAACADDDEENDDAPLTPDGESAGVFAATAART